MPAVSEAQRRFMGMQLGKKRAGKHTDVKMSESQLRDFAKGRKKHKKRHPHRKPKRKI